MRDFGEQQPQQPSRTNKGPLLITVLVVLAVFVGVMFWFAQQQSAPEPVVQPTPETPQTLVEIEPSVEPEAEPEAEPAQTSEEIAATVELAPEVVTEQPLPALDESTELVISDLQAAEQDISPLVSQQLIRDAVVFVDNLRQGLIIREKSVIEGPKAQFRVLEQDGKLYIDPRSYDRYNSLVDWFVSLDTEVVVNLLTRYQPLVKSALGEIGYPEQDPSGVLQEAMEVLLATPSVGTVIEVNDDSVMYRFADPALEALPAAQKQMLRTGPDNMRRVKLKLQELQQALATE